MPCYTPKDEDHIASIRARGGSGLVKSEMPAVLCAILTIIPDVPALLAQVDWKQAGVRRRDVEKWWADHQQADRNRRGEAMIEDMIEAANMAIQGYMESGDPSPHMEYVMTPRQLANLRKEADNVGLSLLQQRSSDGRFEFMNHVIREDSSVATWSLQPISDGHA